MIGCAEGRHFFADGDANGGGGIIGRILKGKTEREEEDRKDYGFACPAIHFEFPPSAMWLARRTRSYIMNQIQNVRLEIESTQRVVNRPPHDDPTFDRMRKGLHGWAITAITKPLNAMAILQIPWSDGRLD
ncbi:MAG TPA: hypothetical protein VGZ48_02670 [Candidatus Acidoferrales bacterium]|nr:hypothetical protein [Candidatus Acidoferrales bacterium]